MLIIAGHLLVDPTDRDTFLTGCAGVVEQARRAPGCLDFTLSGDLLAPGRINVFERWESEEHLLAFRGSGPSGEQGAAILGADVSRYEISATGPA